MTRFLERDRVAHALPDPETLDLYDFGWKALVRGGESALEADRGTVARGSRQSAASPSAGTSR
jgi:hypothetical protein